MITNITQEGKDELLKRAHDHLNAKTLTKGIVADNNPAGWEFETGDGVVRLWDDIPDTGRASVCAIGCLATPLKPGEFVKVDDPKRGYIILEEQFGIPAELSRIADAIFELLPMEEARIWPTQFAQALPVGIASVAIDLEEDSIEEVYSTRFGGQEWSSVKGMPEESREARDYVLAKLTGSVEND